MKCPFDLPMMSCPHDVLPMVQDYITPKGYMVFFEFRSGSHFLDLHPKKFYF